MSSSKPSPDVVDRPDDLQGLVPVKWGAAIGAAIASGIAYLMVDAFEQGYNTYFSIPIYFIDASIPEVFHDISDSAIAWEALLRGSLWLGTASLVTFLMAAYTLIRLPVKFYWTHPLAFGIACSVSFATAFIVPPWLSLVCGLLAFVCWVRLAKPKASSRGKRSLFIILGDPAWLLKVLVITFYVVSPSFFLGYSYATYQTRFELSRSSNADSGRLAALRFLSDDLVVLAPFSWESATSRNASCEGSLPQITDSVTARKLGEAPELTFDDVTLCDPPVVVDSRGHDVHRQSSWFSIRGSESWLPNIPFLLHEQ